MRHGNLIVDVIEDRIYGVKGLACDGERIQILDRVNGTRHYAGVRRLTIKRKLLGLNLPKGKPPLFQSYASSNLASLTV